MRTHLKFSKLKTAFDEKAQTASGLSLFRVPATARSYAIWWGSTNPHNDWLNQYRSISDERLEGYDMYLLKNKKGTAIGYCMVKLEAAPGVPNLNPVQRMGLLPGCEDCESDFRAMVKRTISRSGSLRANSRFGAPSVDIYRRKQETAEFHFNRVDSLAEELKMAAFPGFVGRRSPYATHEEKRGFIARSIRYVFKDVFGLN